MVLLQEGQDSNNYCQILEAGLLPFVAGIFEELYFWLVRQDNVAVHTSLEMNTWMRNKTTFALTWPEKFRNYNLIENVWGAMTRRVYISHRFYDAINDLKVRIKDVCEILTNECIQTL